MQVHACNDMDNLIDLTGCDSSDDEGQDSPILLRSPVVLSDWAELEKALSCPITSKDTESTTAKKESIGLLETPHPSRGGLLNKIGLSDTSPHRPPLSAGMEAGSPVTPGGSRKLQPTAKPFTASRLSPRPGEVSDSTVASELSGVTSLEGSTVTPTVVSRTPTSPNFPTERDARDYQQPSTPLAAGQKSSRPSEAPSSPPATPTQPLQRQQVTDSTPTRKQKPSQLDLNMSELVLQPGYGSTVPSSPVKAQGGDDPSDKALPTTPASRDGQVSEAPTSRPLSPIRRLTASMRAFSLERDDSEDRVQPRVSAIDSPGIQNARMASAKEDDGSHTQSSSWKERMAEAVAPDGDAGKASESIAEDSQADASFKAMLERVGEEAGVLDKLWDRLKDEVYQFSAGIEQVVARLHGLSGGPGGVVPAVQSKTDSGRPLADEPSDGEAKTRPELEARCLVLSAELRSALERRVECEVRLAKVTRDRQRLRDREKLWERQKGMFEQKYFELEDRLAGLGSEPRTPSTKRFAVVLLEGTSKLFPPKLIDKAFEGGELASESILDAVKARLDYKSKPAHQDAKTPLVILVQVQLDIITMMNEYEDCGFTIKMSDIKKFLDGFASISAHVNVIDGPNPSSKVKAQADFWVGVQDCVAIVMTSSNPVDANRLDTSDKLFILGEDGGSSDPKIISPPALFGSGNAKNASLSTRGHAQRSTTRDVSPASIVRTDYSRPEPTATPRPVEPTSPARTVDLLRARPLVSPATEARGRKPSSPQSPVKKQKKPAPGAGGKPAPTAPKAMLQAPTPVATSGGSLLDRYHATHTQSIAGETDREGSPTPAKPPHRPLKDRFTGRTSIVVPYAHGEEPSASPPESDGDAPSVHLPHSAVKHVQRPITINRDSGSASPVSVTSSSVASSRQGVSVWRQTFNTMSRTVSGSNSTPLGLRQPSHLAGRIHGFKVHKP